MTALYNVSSYTCGCSDINYIDYLFMDTNLYEKTEFGKSKLSR